MKLSSPAFDSGGKIPSQHTCDGADINPALQIEEVPDDTKSLVLIMDDPDVPREIREDGMWDHWIVFNIPPDVREVAENQEPPGGHGAGTSGNSEYNGPCPPDGEHGYRFKLYALDQMLDLEEGSSKSDVEAAMEGHLLEATTLIGLYERIG